MPRTTIDLDARVLRELKRRKGRDGRSLGQLASELLAAALDASDSAPRGPFRWHSAGMGARVDLDDKEALRRALDDA
jgi:hypothetical protein